MNETKDSNSNWKRIMSFQKTNRRKATIEEASQLGIILIESCKVDPVYESQWLRDCRMYCLFDSAAMAVDFWESRGFDMTLFADKVVALLQN